MILEEETYKKFGYYPSEISYRAKMTVIAKCEDCCKIREVQKGSYRDLCASCVRKGERNANWKPKVELICEYCGISFMLLPSEIRGGRGTYCSNYCKYKAMEGKYKGEKGPTWVLRSQKRCEYCGREFETDPRQQNKRFCSVSCLGSFHSGENHPNWKEGASFEPYCHRFNGEIKEKVRGYYGRRCFKCDKTEEENNERLCVHHVDFNKNQGCDSHKWKLIPLCRSCHSWTNGNRELSQAMFEDKLAQVGTPNF